MFKSKLVNVTNEIGVKAFLLASTTHLAEDRLRGRTGCIERAEIHSGAGHRGA